MCVWRGGGGGGRGGGEGGGLRVVVLASLPSFPCRDSVLSVLDFGKLLF